MWDVLKEYPAARVRLEAIAVKRLEKYKKAPLEKGMENYRIIICVSVYHVEILCVRHKYLIPLSIRLIKNSLCFINQKNWYILPTSQDIHS